MEFFRVKDGKVVELVSCSECPGENWRQVDLNGGIYVGADVRMFNNDWAMRPLQELVDNGLIVLESALEGSAYPAGTVLEKVKNNTIVKKTLYDFAKEGATQLGALEYLDDEAEVIKIAASVEELLSLGKIELIQASQLKAQELRHRRSVSLMALDGLVMNPLRWASFSVEQQQLLVAYRQELLDVPQQSGFPWEVVWPNIPNTVG